MKKRRIFASILTIPILIILVHNFIPHNHHQNDSICEQQNFCSLISDYITHNDFSHFDIENESHENNHSCHFSIDVLIKHQNSSNWLYSTILNSEYTNSYIPKYLFTEELPETLFIKEQKAFLSSESLRAPPFIV